VSANDRDVGGHVECRFVKGSQVAREVGCSRSRPLHPRVWRDMLRIGQTCTSWNKVQMLSASRLPHPGGQISKENERWNWRGIGVGMNCGTRKVDSASDIQKIEIKRFEVARFTSHDSTIVRRSTLGHPQCTFCARVNSLSLYNPFQAFDGIHAYCDCSTGTCPPSGRSRIASLRCRMLLRRTCT